MRRKPANLADEQTTADEPRTEGAPAAEDASAADGHAETVPPRRKGYTPSKRDRGITTPKRPSQARRPAARQVPPSRLSKEERRKLREQRREMRRKAIEGMKQGDPRYLQPRDRGPERALVRDVVDSRRTMATWFFAVALVVVLLSNTAVPMLIAAANAMFITLTLAVILESVLICRRVKRLVLERHPDSGIPMRSLYFYAVVRAFQFRRLRIPLPRVQPGDPI